MVAVVVEVVVWSSAVKVVWFGDAYAGVGTGRLMAAEGARVELLLRVGTRTTPVFPCLSAKASRRG